MLAACGVATTEGTDLGRQLWSRQLSKSSKSSKAPKSSKSSKAPKSSSGKNGKGSKKESKRGRTPSTMIPSPPVVGDELKYSFQGELPRENTCSFDKNFDIIFDYDAPLADGAGIFSYCWLVGTGALVGRFFLESEDFDVLVLLDLREIFQHVHEGLYQFDKFGGVSGGNAYPKCVTSFSNCYSVPLYCVKSVSKFDKIDGSGTWDSEDTWSFDWIFTDFVVPNDGKCYSPSSSPNSSFYPSSIATSGTSSIDSTQF